MGKDTGFLDYARKVPGYRPVEQRLGDYRAVECMLTEEQVRESLASIINKICKSILNN